MATRQIFAAGVFGALAAGVAPAQSVCRPVASTPEARLLAFYATPLAFSAAPGTGALARGQVMVTGELTWIPDPPASIRSSSGVCGFSKPEHSGLSPVFPRPRVAVGLGGGWTVEASWLPPVTVADATPHLGALALSWIPPVTLPGGARLLLRGHTTLGGVDGPITCPASALQTTSPAANCHGTKPSNDTYDPGASGAEAIVASHTGVVRWYAGVGANVLRSHLQVNFTNQDGVVDRNQVEIDLTRAALLAGAAWALRGDRVALTAQLYAVSDDATTGRVGIAWRLR